ncbi:MAG: 4-alpha-glucanotransferase [Thermodesulfobacteriota bacterium]
MDLPIKIATLGRLCGIAPEYVDNFGVRRPTSPATYQALLTAMEIPWEDPEQASREIARRRVRPWAGLVDSLTVVLADSTPPSLVISPWTRTPELPPLLVQAVIKNEAGQESAWEIILPSSPPLAQKAVDDHLWGRGFRTRLEMSLPPELPPGYYDLSLEVEGGERRETRLIVAPPGAYSPPCLTQGQRLWGLSLPLYALKSEGHWGLGDFTDLQEVTDWAGELGAAFVGVNPLHARSPGDKIDPSPYSPSSRVFRDFLYLDPEAVPEFKDSQAAQALVRSPETQALRSRVQAAPLVDYPAVYRLKRRILGLLYQEFQERHGSPEHPRTARGREFRGFLDEGGLPLLRFGQYCALAEALGRNHWHDWPRAYQHPENPGVAAFTQENREEILLQQYLQWLVASQLEEAQTRARKQGLPFTLYQDLALGAHPGGAETWAHPQLFARGASLGAPPDAFNPQGQNWGLPPLIPERLRREGYRLFIDTLRANLPRDGLLRLDHVMGLFRLFWIPQGRGAAEGAYVHYPSREMLAILNLESQRRRTLIIGEDLGTVAPRIRRELARRGILSYRVFYFERTGDQGFKAPADYPRQAMAAVTTHDLPTLAGYWQGEDIRLKRALDLYPEAHLADADTAARDRDRDRLLGTLGIVGKDFREGGQGSAQAGKPVPPPAPPSVEPPLSTPHEDYAGDAPGEACPEEVRFGVLEYLAKSRAALLEVRLEEIFGVPYQQNLPGTTTQYPNWRRKLPLTLKEMRRNPAAARLAARLRQERAVSSKQ